VSALTCIAKWFRGVAGIAVLGIGVASLLGAGTVTALAQAPTTVERTAKGATAKSIEVGLFLNVKPDCTSGTLPAIRLVEAPANGTVIIKQAKVRATNYKQCLALEVPAFIAFYQSKPDFSGMPVSRPNWARSMFSSPPPTPATPPARSMARRAARANPEGRSPQNAGLRLVT
jgi:hypothetical protein